MPGFAESFMDPSQPAFKRAMEERERRREFIKFVADRFEILPHPVVKLNGASVVDGIIMDERDVVFFTNYHSLVYPYLLYLLELDEEQTYCTRGIKEHYDDKGERSHTYSVTLKRRYLPLVDK